MSQRAPSQLSPTEVLRLRLAAQLLDAIRPRSPGEVVTWFGAMQAQDLNSGHWSFGARCDGLTDDDIHAATANREILRTWPMRGTVHFVPPADARWMLEVTGARALRGAARRREFLGLSETTVDRAADVLGSALAGGRRLTRAECIAALVDGGVPEAADHGYHFLWYISQIGVTCIGPQVGKEQTFVLLDEWVPKPRQLDRDEALAELAVRFVRSHGPVTRHDLARWTGLTMTDAKAGLAAASDVLTEVDCATSDGPTAMWVTDDALEAALDVDGRPGLDDPEPVVLLPGFDEYMLGYGDRSAMLDPAFNQRICPGNNGMFKPTIVGGGTVLGTWKRTVKTSTVDIDLDPFAPLPSAVRGGIDAAAERYGQFHGRDARVSLSTG